MPSPATEIQPAHALLWARWQKLNAKQRLPQALLLVGPQSVGAIDFAYKMSAAILCAQQQKPCGQCKSCRLSQTRKHPDLYLLKPEQSGEAIKVDQIRDLHQLVFTSPQLANKRVVIISPAEKMNISAANALLKVLEEPPACVIFLLIAEQMSTLPLTIISRCQLWRFSSAKILDADYLTLAEGDKLIEIIQDIADLVAKRLSVCALAEKWANYDFHNLLGIIYLLNAQMIAYQLNGRRSEKNWTESLYQLARNFRPIDLFRQLDQINNLNKKLQRHISLNQILALENLLLGYIRRAATI
jgi:DNA polymerase III subunit delta'